MTTSAPAKQSWRAGLLCAVGGVSVLGLALHAPIPQDPSYHAFADQRRLLGVPNFWDVVSNLPFFLAGVAGLRALRRECLPGALPPLYSAYATFFVGAVLVAFGSGYYHWHPDNDSLVWDRLPMTIGFMAFVSLVIGEHGHPDRGRRCLPWLLVLGVASVLYWAVTESQGRGDLRPYAVIQFLPILLIPLTIVLYPSAFSGVRYLWGIVGAYAVAKVLESLDAPIYRACGFFSGHTLKHVAAAAGVYLLVPALRYRTLAGPENGATPQVARSRDPSAEPSHSG